MLYQIHCLIWKNFHELSDNFFFLHIDTSFFGAIVHIYFIIFIIVAIIFNQILCELWSLDCLLLNHFHFICLRRRIFFYHFTNLRFLSVRNFNFCFGFLLRLSHFFRLSWQVVIFLALNFLVLFNFNGIFRCFSKRVLSFCCFSAFLWIIRDGYVVLLEKFFILKKSFILLIDFFWEFCVVKGKILFVNNQFFDFIFSIFLFSHNLCEFLFIYFYFLVFIF